MIRIAKSHHGRCIICRRKTSLHKVKQESIVFAFLFNIMLDAALGI
jgi:hypothetical protein